MGLLRVGMSIGTLGAVSPYSRQSRDTRVIMREAKKQTKLLAQLADPQSPTLAPSIHEKVLADSARRRETSQTSTQRRSQMRVNSFSTLIVRLLGWLIVAFFAIGAIGAAENASVIGAVVCFMIAAGTAALLLKAQKNQPAK